MADRLQKPAAIIDVGLDDCKNPQSDLPHIK
jgi:hypothetical protein